MSFMAYWNGAYSGTSSNLTYCKQGTIIGSNNIGSQSVKYATTSGSCSGNAATATKATQDGNGKVIASTYLPLADKGLSNGKVPYYVNFPRYPQLVDLGYNEESTKTSDEAYLKGLCKWAIDNFAGQGQIILIGNAIPNSSGFCYIQLYSSDGKDATTGLPRYCSGTYISLDRVTTNFSCTNYRWTFGGRFYGNASSSSKWATPRTITLTGSVTGSVSIDGSQNVSLATTTNHTHNYAGSSSAGGSANSALTLLYNNKFDTTYGSYAIFQQSSNISDFPHNGWFNSIKMLHNNSYGYFTEIATSFTGEDGMWRRALLSGTQVGWYKILDSGNFNSYAPKLDGTGASGTWGINISGNAATVGDITGILIPAMDVKTGYWRTLGYGSTKKLSIGSNYGGIAWNAQNYCADLMFGCNLGTLGFISIGYNSPIVSFAGSNDTNASNDNPNWYFKLTGTSGTIYNLNCAPTATKLATSRTIWGQSFDGTGNVSGFPSFPACININRNAQTGAILDPSKIGFEIETYANDARLKTYTASGGSNPTHLVLTSSGNVGIGTISPSYKLHVVGTAYASGGLVSDGPVKVNEYFVVDGTNGG